MRAGDGSGERIHNADRYKPRRAAGSKVKGGEANWGSEHQIQTERKRQTVKQETQTQAAAHTKGEPSPVHPALPRNMACRHVARDAPAAKSSSDSGGDPRHSVFRRQYPTSGTMSTSWFRHINDNAVSRQKQPWADTTSRARSSSPRRASSRHTHGIGSGAVHPAKRQPPLILMSTRHRSSILGTDLEDDK